MTRLGPRGCRSLRSRSWRTPRPGPGLLTRYSHCRPAKWGKLLRQVLLVRLRDMERESHEARFPANRPRPVNVSVFRETCGMPECNIYAAGCLVRVYGKHSCYCGKTYVRPLGPKYGHALVGVEYMGLNVVEDLRFSVQLGHGA